MSDQPTPTPGPWASHLVDSALVTAADGQEVANCAFEYEARAEECEENAYLIAFSCNAVQSLASHLNVPAAPLAEKLADGGLVELFDKAKEYQEDAHERWCDDEGHCEECWTTAAILDRLRAGGEG